MSDFEPLDFKKEGIVLDYKTAGVDIDAGNKFVEDLKQKVPALGGFGGMFPMTKKMMRNIHILQRKMLRRIIGGR